MPTWKYTNKDVSPTKAEESLQAIKSACFGCESHNADCAIAKAAGEVSEMLSCDALSVKEQIHGQISGALAGATFPINNPEDLIVAFPNGAETTCQVGTLRMTAGEAGKLLTASDFPFVSAKNVADTIVERAGL